MEKPRVKKTVHIPNPYENSNGVSGLFFCWCTRIFNTIRIHGISEELIFAPLPTDQCEHLCEELHLKVYRHTTHKTITLLNLRKLMAIYCTTLEYLQWFAFTSAAQIILRYLSLFTMIYMLKHFARCNPKDNEDIAGLGLLTFFLTIFVFAMCLFRYQRTFWARWYGERICIALIGVVFQKLTLLPLKLLTPEKVNKLITCLLNDLSAISELPMLSQDILIAPVVFLIAIPFLYVYLGTAAFFGIALYLFLAIPIQAFAAYNAAKLTKRIMKNRISMLSSIYEVLFGIETVKMNCLQEIYIKKISSAYYKEVHLNEFRAIFQIITWVSVRIWHHLATLFTLFIFFLQDNKVTCIEVMVCLIVFEDVCSYLLVVVSKTIIAYYKCQRLLSFINDFLRQHEQRHNQKLTNFEKWEIHFMNVSTFSKQLQEQVKKLHLVVPERKLTVICGGYNSGARTIIPILTDDVILKSGKIRVGGEISYYFKELLTIGASVKMNITLGSKFDKYHYCMIKKLCGLNSELRRFDARDEYVLGNEEYCPALEHKIMLARTLYKIADIYVFEEPPLKIISSRGRLIFEDCIFKYLVNITRLVVSNNYVYLKNADKVCYFENGALIAEGTLDEIRKKVKDFDLIIKYGPAYCQKSKTHKLQRVSVTNSDKSASVLDITRTYTDSKRTLVGKYFGGPRIIYFLLFAAFILTGSVSTASEYFLFSWSTNGFMKHFNEVPSSNKSSYMYQLNTSFSRSWYDFYDSFALRLFFILTIALVPVLIIQHISIVIMSIQSSKRFFPKLLAIVLRATLPFYNNISLIQLYEVFARDIVVIDDYLLEALIGSLHTLTTIIFTIVLFIYLDYLLAGALAAYLLVCVLLVCCFKKCCKRLIRLEYDLKYPIMMHIVQTSNLLGILRSSNMVKHYAKRFYELVNQHTTASFLLLTLNQAFGLWIALSSIILAMAMGTFYFIEFFTTSVRSDMINIVFYYMTMVIAFVPFGIEQLYTILYVNQHLENVVEYEVPEVEDSESGLKYPKLWTHTPTIKFNNINAIVYGHIVFRQLNLTITPGEHIGIIGRTGSGRRILMKMMLRLYNYDGTIELDYQDVREVNLCTLRRNIIHISATTTLFAPTLRFNLDPHNEYTDAVLWNALQRVGLTQNMISLDNPVESCGYNFNLEERVLILLARSLLLRNKILIVENIFAKIDKDSLNEIEEIIFEEFFDCTIIVLESQLNYIMRCNRIVVMDQGRILEDDNPLSLYKKQSGFIRSVIDQSGYVLDDRINKSRQKLKFSTQLDSSLDSHSQKNSSESGGGHNNASKPPIQPNSTFKND